MYRTLRNITIKIIGGGTWRESATSYYSKLKYWNFRIYIYLNWQHLCSNSKLTTTI